jgi:hypothetical protein
MDRVGHAPLTFLSPLRPHSAGGFLLLKGQRGFASNTAFKFKRTQLVFHFATSGAVIIVSPRAFAGDFIDQPITPFAPVDRNVVFVGFNANANGLCASPQIG